jgi:hypothetical protein
MHNLLAQGRRVEGLYVDGRRAHWVSVVVDRPPNWLLVEKEWVGDANPWVAGPEILKLRSDLVNGEASRALYAGPEELLGRDPWTAGMWLPRQLRDAFAEAGLPFASANEDPPAGLEHLRRLRTPRSDLAFPQWHPTRAGEEGGSRRLFLSRACPRLREQLESVVSAEDDEKQPGAVASPRWEKAAGGLFVAARYACLAAVDPTETPEPWEPDVRSRLTVAAIKARNDAYENSRPRPDYSSHMG